MRGDAEAAAVIELVEVVVEGAQDGVAEVVEREGGRSSICRQRDFEDVKAVRERGFGQLKVPVPFGEEELQQGLKRPEGGRLFECELMTGQQAEGRFAERRPLDASDGPPRAGFPLSILDSDAAEQLQQRGVVRST